MTIKLSIKFIDNLYNLYYNNELLIFNKIQNMR